MVKILVITISLLIAASMIKCNSDQQSKTESKHYKLRMKIENMGRVRYGIGVFKEKPLYSFEFTSLGKMDYFSFTSCATHISRVDAGGLIFKRKTTKLNWKPGTLDKGCEVLIAVTEKLKHRHTSGYIVFENSKYKLDAVIECGNKKSVGEGVSVCQNITGNLNKITFQEPVNVNSETCSIEEIKEDEYIIRMQPGFCKYMFKGQLSKRYHKLVTYGYNDDLLE